MKNLWDRIKNVVLDGVTVAAEKTGEYTKLGKVKIDILNTKRKISKSFTELGALTYEASNQGTIDKLGNSDEFQAQTTALKSLEAELDKKERAFADLMKKPGTDEKAESSDQAEEK